MRFANSIHEYKRCGHYFIALLWQIICLLNMSLKILTFFSPSIPIESFPSNGFIEIWLVENLPDQ